MQRVYPEGMTRAGQARSLVALGAALRRGIAARTPGARPLELWRWSEVERWLAASLEEEAVAVEDHALAAIHAGLELRHYGHWLDAGWRARLRALAGLTVGEEPGGSGRAT